MNIPHSKALLPLALLLSLCTSAGAQDILVAKYNPTRIAAYSGVDGSMLNTSFIDYAGLSTSATTSLIYGVVEAPNGEIWVSSYTQQDVLRFSGDGTQYLGSFGAPAGLYTGMAIESGSVWVSTVGGGTGNGVAYFDPSTYASQGFVSSTGAWAAFGYNGSVLLSHTNGTIESVDPVSALSTGTFAAPAGAGLLEQMILAPNGNLIVADFTNKGYHELDPMGNLVASHTLSSAGNVRGIALLGNGQVLLSTTSGVYTYDPVSATGVLVDGGDAGAFCGAGSVASSIGMTYCTATPNSTALVGEISALGSTSVSNNDVTLRASNLPQMQFAYFLNSTTQSFVPNPNASQGNLCLGGAIGRYNGAGLILNTGMSGSVSLALDLTSTPTPTGPISIAAGQTWNFQCWYRDLNPAPTSNFTDGLTISF